MRASYSRRKRLDGSELASPLGGICFRRFQKKHISIRSSLIRAFTAEVAHECQTCSSLLPYTEQKSVTLRTYRAVGREGEAMCRTSACASLPVSFGLITQAPRTDVAHFLNDRLPHRPLSGHSAVHTNAGRNGHARSSHSQTLCHQPVPPP